MTAIENKFEVVGQGIIAALADGTGIGRTLTAGPGILVTNGDGIAGNPTFTALGPDGFGFFVGGLMTNGELLGMGVFDKDIAFPSVVNSAVVKSLFPANGPAVLNIMAVIAGVDTQVGTISFTAGGQVGTVIWMTDPYVLTNGTPLKLFAPSPRDITLSMVTGLVPGDLS